MPNVTNKSVGLEILVSTMYRTDLKFLDNMFTSLSHESFKILIINQTSRDRLLKSEYENIRVINSFERGLPQSRNLAIENAIGEMCLIADDDVTYVSHFDSIIIDAFDANKTADLITFKMVDGEGKLYKHYVPVHQHDKKTIKTINSVVIAFRRQNIRDAKVVFNTNFGLGTTFETADEYVFLRNALKAKLKLFFVPKIILSHEDISSGQKDGTDKIVYARAALFYKYSGFLGYLRLCKYLYALSRKQIITNTELMPKFKVGLQGIRTYKKLVVSGLE